MKIILVFLILFYILFAGSSCSSLREGKTIDNNPSHTKKQQTPENTLQTNITTDTDESEEGLIRDDQTIPQYNSYNEERYENEDAPFEE